MKKAIITFVIIALIISCTTISLAATPNEDLLSALRAVPYLEDAVLWENDTDAVDDHGLQPHSLHVVVDGGATTPVAQAIFTKLPVGITTEGTTSTTVTDESGNTHTINFSRSSDVRLMITIYIRTLPGYDASTTPDAIKNAVKTTVDKLTIGQSFYIPFLYAPILALDDLEHPTFIISSIVASSTSTSSSFEIPIGPTERAKIPLVNISVEATPLY